MADEKADRKVPRKAEATAEAKKASEPVKADPGPFPFPNRGHAKATSPEEYEAASKRHEIESAKNGGDMALMHAQLCDYYRAGAAWLRANR